MKFQRTAKALTVIPLKTNPPLRVYAFTYIYLTFEISNENLTKSLYPWYRIVMAEQTWTEKLETLCRRIENEMAERNNVRFKILQDAAQEKGHRNYEEIEVDMGAKYAKIVKVFQPQGSRSVHLFVCKQTGVIFGSEGWKKPNFTRSYGTLDTTDQWTWGEFYPISKTGADTLVPKAERRGK